LEVFFFLHFFLQLFLASASSTAKAWIPRAASAAAKPPPVSRCSIERLDVSDVASAVANASNRFASTAVLLSPPDEAADTSYDYGPADAAHYSKVYQLCQ
jgi:hypothetical protein